MARYIPLLTSVFLLLSVFSFGQNDYQMQPGEVIIVDPDGRIINSNSKSFNKNYPGNSSNNNSGKSSDYNDDGTLKIPGYTPTGNSQVDAENYKKAKLLFSQNQPEEFKKWQEKHSQPPHEGHIKEIPKKEFDRMPPHKQKHILDNPGKYKIVK